MSTFTRLCGLCCFVSYLFVALFFVQDVQARSIDASPLVERQMFDTGPSKISDDELIHRREFFQYVTRPDIEAPRWDVKVYNKSALSSGYWFTASYEYVQQKADDHRKYIAPHIYDQQGELIWSGAPLLKGYNLKDFRVQNVAGTPMLTGIYVQNGANLMINKHYEIEEELHMHGGMDIHEFHLVENGTRALATTLQRYEASIEESETVGFDGRCKVVTTGFKEFDTKSWNITFEWSGREHIAINESYLETNCKGQWDFIHSNSVDKFPDGDYLLCGRHTDTLYKISAQDGRILWRLGGKNTNFVMNGHFSGQHHARVMSQNSTHTVISLLDNAIRPGERHITNDQSRGMIIVLRDDIRPMTADVINTYNHPQGGYSDGRGALQMLDNGNAFAAWWMQSLISEHSHDDQVLMEASWKPMLKSYRSFKCDWVGLPKSPPDVHAEAVTDSSDDLTTAVYVSWNGATEVTHWRLYKTSSADGEEKQVLMTSPRQGFETMLAYSGFATYVVVEALDRDGKSLGISSVVRTIPPVNPMHPAVVQAQLSDPSVVHDDQAWKVRASAALDNQVAMYIAGIMCCVTLMVVVKAVMRMRARKTGFRPLRWQRGSE